MSLDEFVERLAPPRAVWVMVPAGAPTEQVVARSRRALASGDVIIDGGNSYFKDDVRRAATLGAKGIHYVDVGTSGGVWGLERGYCLMIGGEPDVVARLDPIFKHAGARARDDAANAGPRGTAAPPRRAICTAARPAPATS